jgi:hypothetical protein
MTCNCRLGVLSLVEMFVLEEGGLLLLQCAGTDDFGKERKDCFSQRSRLHEFDHMKLLQAVAQELSLAKTEDMRNG